MCLKARVQQSQSTPRKQVVRVLNARRLFSVSFPARLSWMRAVDGMCTALEARESSAMQDSIEPPLPSEAARTERLHTHTSTQKQKALN